MRFPVDDPVRVVSWYNEPRPLSAPPEQRTLIHGAWDIAVPVGTPIRAPENGKLLVANIFRSQKPMAKPDLFWLDGQWFAHSKFYNDTYGAIALLYGESGITHLFAHLNQEEWWRIAGVDRKMKKEDYDRWVMLYSNMDSLVEVREGDVVAHSGDEGSSFGPHIHMSLHKGRAWERIDPASVWRGVGGSP